MKYFDWDEEKNEKLRRERDISFEEVVAALWEGRELDILPHPNKTRYPNQRILIVNIDNYAYVVPFVEDAKKVFFKTIMPSRKMTKKYILSRQKK